MIVIHYVFAKVNSVREGASTVDCGLLGGRSAPAHIYRPFHLSSGFITFADCSAHLEYRCTEEWSKKQQHLPLPNSVFLVRWFFGQMVYQLAVTAANL